MTWPRILEWLAVIPLGLSIGLVVVIVGVVGIALWAGWSRNRDLRRRGWKNIGRF